MPALLALAALVALAAAFALRQVPAPGAESNARAANQDVFARGPAAGVPVRLQVARAGFDLLADDPWAGVGTGQWMARFPAVRDLEEIERSTQGRRLAEDTEVEHPHDDWLLPLFEGGCLGGLPWLAFLAAGSWCALRGLYNIYYKLTYNLTVNVNGGMDIKSTRNRRPLVRVLLRSTLIEIVIGSARHITAVARQADATRACPDTLATLAKGCLDL